jgi:hypothetical protein
MSEITEDILSFIRHFEEQRDAIDAIPHELYARQFKKALYVSVLDALSRCVYPRRRNRDRFTRFVRMFATWPNEARVSLPHLVRLVAVVPDPEFSKLRRFACSELDGWEHGRIIELSRDPDLASILKLWPSSGEPLQGVRADSLQHLRLLYQYRNSLLHEFRQPRGSDISDNHEPHYMYCLPDPGGPPGRNGVWHLSYPVHFFKGLVTSALANLQQYLLDNQINPYESYVFGDYWLDPLNR